MTTMDSSSHSIASANAAASTSTSSSSRDDIMEKIASQALSVRRQFESMPTKRKHAVSAVTAAAAEHMASLNRKRQFEMRVRLQSSGAAPPSSYSAASDLADAGASSGGVPAEYWSRLSRAFGSPVETAMARQVTCSSDGGGDPTPRRTEAPSKKPRPPRVSDGIVLRAHPEDITVTYNDVVCGKGPTTSSLVGNQRYKVYINLHKGAFAKSHSDSERRNIAASIVSAITSTSVPPGRFLSLDIHTGLWYDVGFDRAVGITMEMLYSECGIMDRGGAAAIAAARAPAARRSSMPRTFTSKAA